MIGSSGALHAFAIRQAAHDSDASLCVGELATRLMGPCCLAFASWTQCEDARLERGAAPRILVRANLGDHETAVAVARELGRWWLERVGASPSAVQEELGRLIDAIASALVRPMGSGLHSRAIVA